MVVGLATPLGAKRIRFRVYLIIRNQPRVSGSPGCPKPTAETADLFQLVQKLPADRQLYSLTQAVQQEFAGFRFAVAEYLMRGVRVDDYAHLNDRLPSEFLP